MCFFFACDHAKDGPRFTLLQCGSIYRQHMLDQVTAKLLGTTGQTVFVSEQDPRAFCQTKTARNEFVYKENSADCAVCTINANTGQEIEGSLFSRALAESKDSEKQIFFRKLGLFVILEPENAIDVEKAEDKRILEPAKIDTFDSKERSGNAEHKNAITRKEIVRRFQ